MKHKLFFPLMICALLLAGCYRQAADSSYQQVDSRGVEEIVSLPAAQGVSQQTALTPDASASGDYLTPQPPPAQVEQPTAVTPTAVPTAAPTATAPPALEVFPTATTASAAPGEEGGECVYAVQAGDTLFRLSLAYETTVDDLMDFNELEDDALQIGQILRIPNCVQAEEDSETDAIGGDSAATVAPVETTAVPTPGRLIHIVASGDTIGSLSLRYDVSMDEIVSLNRLANPDALSIGQELLIPIESPES